MSNDIKVAIFIHAGLDTREGAMKVFNALQAAKEFKDAGDYVDVIFDGEGTRTAVEINQPDHFLYQAFKDIEDVVTGVCRYCIARFDMTDQAQSQGFTLLDDYNSHPSYRNFINSGYQVLNF